MMAFPIIMAISFGIGLAARPTNDVYRIEPGTLFGQAKIAKPNLIQIESVGTLNLDSEKSLGFEDREPTVFSREAFNRLVQSNGDWHDSGFDMETAKVYAQLSSVAYCSSSAVINAWNCTRWLKYNLNKLRWKWRVCCAAYCCNPFLLWTDTCQYWCCFFLEPTYGI